ncbi:MAG TPA: CoA transferase, partial [Marinobacter salarius]
PPVEMRHVMDHSAGYHAVVALMAALHQRRRTGEGQYIDLAARDVASAMIGDALLMASLGEDPVRPGNDDPRMAPHGVYATANTDRWLTIAVRNDREWRALVGIIGTPGAADDPRFASAGARRRNSCSLDQLITEWLQHLDAEATAQQLQATGVCAHPSWNMQEIADDPHLRQRGALTEVHDPSYPGRLAVGTPARFSRTRDVGIRRETPELGQDEDYVFGELLGIGARQRADLEQREVIM